MKQLKKLTLTLALLIMAVDGAWAQTAFGVKEITADMLPASWSTDESAVTADDLAKLGFMEVTEAEAQAWTGAPQQGNVRLIYTPCKSVNWVNGEGGYSTSSYTRKIFYSCLDGQKIFITTEITEWSLTPDETGKSWTLAKMPASNVELQVEYFAESNLFLSKEALADKTSIAVKAGKDDVEFGEDGKSANTVTEGTAMTVTYNGTKKLLGMKVEKKEAASSQLAAVTTDDIGKVVCTAGHLHDAKTAVPDGCTAVGILGKVTETGHGLIIALQDAPEQKWNTINGWTSASYAGTTLKVLPDDAARGTNLTSYTTLGGTTVSNWAVAQKSDYEAIFTNLGSEKNGSYGMTYDGNVNAYITTGVGGTAISDLNWYWSASENGDNAWYFASYDWDSEMKSTEIYIRPVLGF